jgi:hypothetical protein
MIWSMMPVKKTVNAYLAARDLGPQSVDFHLLRKGKAIASAHLEQVTLADGIQRIRVHDDGLRGTLFVPPGAGRHPALLVVGGSEGGRATASRGLAGVARIRRAGVGILPLRGPASAARIHPARVLPACTAVDGQPAGDR